MQITPLPDSDIKYKLPISELTRIIAHFTRTKPLTSRFKNLKHQWFVTPTGRVLFCVDFKHQNVQYWLKQDNSKYRYRKVFAHFDKDLLKFHHNIIDEHDNIIETILESKLIIEKILKKPYKYRMNWL